MSAIIGWVPSSEAASAPKGVDLVVDGEFARVMSATQPHSGRDQLARVQASYRAFRRFLPNAPGLAPPAMADIRDRLNRLAGHGQLRVRLVRLEQAAAPPTRSGREHLRHLRDRRVSEEAWRPMAKAALEEVVSGLPVRDHRIAWRDAEVTMDLLVSSELEEELGGLLAPVIRQAGLGNGAQGELTVSGLWAPIAFAGGDGAVHG